MQQFKRQYPSRTPSRCAAGRLRPDHWIPVSPVCRESRRPGVIAVVASIALVLVLAFAALTVDVGYITVSKGNLQAACDSASLAAAMDLYSDEATARAAADTYLTSNGFDPTDPSITRTVEFGTWDETTRSFIVGTFDAANSVRVDVHVHSIKAFFGAVAGYNSYAVRTESISLPGAIPRDIAIVIDCSTSMGNSMYNGQTRMENTRTAGHELVTRLNSNLDRVGLAVYSWEDTSRDDYRITGRMETPLDFDFDPTDSRISTLDDGEYESGTNIGAGFRAGLDVFLSDSSPRSEPDLVKIVVMLTDGEANKAEPYPSPNDGPTGTLPAGPYSGQSYNDDVSVTKWANTIKARGIKVYCITLGDTAYHPTMVNAASPADDFDDQYYYHVPDGVLDDEILRQVYSHIGGNRGGPHVVR